MSEADDFISDNPRAGVPGTGCKTCAQPQIARINDALKTWHKRTQEGSTAMAFQTFVKGMIDGRIGYRVTTQTVKRHMERCLGLRV
jgi:hypothetical protein